MRQALAVPCQRRRVFAFDMPVRCSTEFLSSQCNETCRHDWDASHNELTCIVENRPYAAESCRPYISVKVS
jgi:hypothetical protein